MATGIIKPNTIIGLEEEVTEGTYVAPSGATSFIQPLKDGFDITPSRELIDRDLLDASPGKVTPRLGTKSAAGALPVEWRGSGVEGGATDFDSLLKGALGASRVIATQSTTKAGNSSTVLQIEDADIGKYSVGDIVVVLESGAHDARPISSITTGAGTATITFPFALDAGAPADNVVISQSQMYLTAATGHPSLSATYFWANEISQALVGAKVTSMALENFTTGQVGSLNFGLESLTYRDETDEAAPFTPVFDDEVPPIILNACVFRAGVQVDVNTLSLSLSNTLGFLTSTCSPNGRVSSRVTDREITGTLNPYKDDTTTTFFDDWTAGTEVSIFAFAFNSSAVTGEFDLGSVVAIWIPQAFTTEFKTGDVEDILVDELTFRATRGADGNSEELFMGFI